ncbi:MAG: hypothetical protein IJ242_09250 [Clostridia bacterium]|nr:hypothetical protein [Clostridia bacterium]
MLLCLCLICLTAQAETTDVPHPGNIILYSFYLQAGWGDRVQLGCLDDQGQVFTMEGSDSQLHWPYDFQSQLTFLTSHSELAYRGTIAHDDLFDIESLIFQTEDQGTASRPGACDAGTEYTYTVQYPKGSDPVRILLGMSGDDIFENTDPNAQSLYWCARQLFPNIWYYAYSDLNMGPAGFRQEKLAAFLGISDSILENGIITCCETDCETGIIPVELTPERESAIRHQLLTSKVIRKASCVSVTGGTFCYTFQDPDGNILGSVELYEGRLVLPGGMYELSMEP